MRKRARLLTVLFIMVLFWTSVTGAMAEPSAHVVSENEVEALFSGYCMEHDLDANLISIAYLYTATGETWYHLEDQWYYSASLYKVPLMMLLTEQEHNGVLFENSLINGIELSTIEEEVLLQSSNPIAYSTLLYFGQPDVTRRMFCQYSSLPEDYYTWDFFGASYFTARYMTDVMETLFLEPDRFPRMIDCMERAQPEHYFRLHLGEEYAIAQKYGSYQEEDGTTWNHTTGIVYTPNPFILTVMTKYGAIAESILGDLAVLFRDYSLMLDQRLSVYEDPDDAVLATEETVSEPEQFKEASVSDMEPPELMLPEQQDDIVRSFELEDNESIQSTSSRVPLIVTCLGSELILIFIYVLLRKRRRVVDSYPERRNTER